MYHCIGVSINQNKKTDSCFTVIIVDYISACTLHKTGLLNTVTLLAYKFLLLNVIPIV